MSEPQELDPNTSPTDPDSASTESMSGAAMFARVFGILVTMYFFLVGIKLMGESFKLLGGGAAGTMFQAIEHPVAGLMVGMIATALIQSSSTTTSIIVSLVAGGALTVPAAIPLIMGANIGTSVTNTLVSMGHAADREEFKRAFAGATVHDFFNILAVIVLLPIETMFGVIEKTSSKLTDMLLGGSGGSFKSPLDLVLKPAVKFFVSVDKAKIKAAAQGQEVDGALLKGGLFHDWSLSDTTAGVAALVISITLTIAALTIVVKLMKSMMEAKAAQFIKKALEANVYVSMLIGVLVTIMVQSSSITTSTLVPLVGVGLINLEAIFPLTLGANIGTTCTAMIAAIANSDEGARFGLQIALCHLIFNMLGILIWFPIPFMRRVPLSMARKLGEIVADHRYFALVYIVVVFFLIPASIVALDKMF